MSVAPVLDLHPDGVVDRLRALCDWARQTATTLPVAGSATQIDRLAAVQDAHAALAALEAAVIVDFARDQVTAASGRALVDYRRLEMSIADQIGKACRVGPTRGRAKLGLARALILDLPTTRQRLADGHISEYAALQIHRATNHLDHHTRAVVDTRLGQQPLHEWVAPRIATTATAYAYAADPAAAVTRGAHARANRRVTLRPAPDTMSLLTGLLPVESGVACYTALRQESDRLRAAGDGRGRGQIMADLLVERLTGRTPTQPVGVHLNLTLPLEHLLDADGTGGAHLAGAGPVPHWLAPTNSSTDRPRPEPPAPQPHAQPRGPTDGVAAAAVHTARPARPGHHRRRLPTPPVRRRSPRHPGRPRPHLPRTLLRRPHPPPRPHRPLSRRRTHQSDRRPRSV